MKNKMIMLSFVLTAIAFSGCGKCRKSCEPCETSCGQELSCSMCGIQESQCGCSQMMESEIPQESMTKRSYRKSRARKAEPTYQEEEPMMEVDEEMEEEDLMPKY